MRRNHSTEGNWVGGVHFNLGAQRYPNSPVSFGRKASLVLAQLQDKLSR